MLYIPKKKRKNKQLVIRVTDETANLWRELLSQYFAERRTADDLLRDALECIKERRRKMVF
jgi:hypothetical protein